MKKVFLRMKKDMKENWVGLTAVAVCLILLEMVTGEICPMQLLFGLPCPGCGLTRAGFLVLTGHFGKAFSMHPFIYVFFAGLMYVFWQRYVKGKKEIPYGIPLLLFVILTMCMFYVYRVWMYFPNVEPMLVSKHTPLIDIRQLVVSIFQ